MGKVTLPEIRNQRSEKICYDLKDLRKFRNEFKSFVESAKISGSIEKNLAKSKAVKCFNILQPI